MVQDDTGWFLDVPRCSQMFLDNPRCFQMFLDVSRFPRCSQMFLDVSSPRWFGIHNISQILQYQPNITISAKYHNISQTSQYQPNIPISAKYNNISQISHLSPNFTISARFHNIFGQLIFSTALGKVIQVLQCSEIYYREQIKLI